MKITYEEFLNKLKPEIRKDLEESPEKEYLFKILDAFYNKLDTYLNQNPKKDEILDIWILHMYDIFKFREFFKNKEYKNAYDYMFTTLACDGSFGYAIIKMCEELFYE